MGIDLFDHIRNMMYTTVPAWLITVLLLWLLPGHMKSAELADIEMFKTWLMASGLVRGVALLPFAVLLVLAMRKVATIYTIVITITVALFITYLYSNPSIGQLGGWFFKGYAPAEGVDLGVVSKLVTRGGIESMFFTQTIVILALSLGGLLSALGILPALLAGVSHMLTRRQIGRASCRERV